MGRKYISYLILLLLLTITYQNVCYGQDEAPVKSDDGDDDDNDVGSSSSQQKHVDYITPQIDEQYLYESFDDKDKFQSRWQKSATHKADSSDLKYDGEWDLVQTQDLLKGNRIFCCKIFLNFILHYNR